MADLTGKSLGKYKVVARLDKGAMGEVYKGYHTTLNRNVAIKVLHPHLANTAGFVQRFEREAEIVARLRHSNIMQVFDFDVQDGLYYMVMEFIDGPTLKAEMRERRAKARDLTLVEIGYIASALAAALDYAHVRGVIHRDIKPANVMFDAEGQIILTDFGIVRIIGDTPIHETDLIVGTPAYMSPEQGSGKEVDVTSDVYSFAVVLYELITGRLPFTADHAVGFLTQHLQAAVPPPRQFNATIPAELEQAVLKALHKEPALRYHKAGQFARDVRQAIGMTAEQALSPASIASVLPAESTAFSSSAGLTDSRLVGEVTEIGTPSKIQQPDLPSPYRGLFAFREEDAKFFFGREEFTEQLLELVKKQPLVAVIGPSGSGKSSVVYAGLLAALRREPGWLIEDFRPSSDPFQAIAGALIPLLQPKLPPAERPSAVAQLTRAILNGDRRLHEVIADIVAAQPQPARLLLVADQFEELFTLGHSVELRNRFLDELAEAIDIQKFLNQQTFCLVLTLRADFLAQALAYRPFAVALQDADVKLGPMSRQDLARAIANPAKRLGVRFESGLVLRIVNDVGDEPGNLPLLEFALAALWEQRQEQLMNHEAYERIGGVAGALARHANEVYASLSPHEQQLARRAFVQMVQPGDGVEDTRRVATRDELTAEEWQLVQKLANERLIVTGLNEAGRETAEVVHEALIRSWGLLREWMTTDRAYRAWQERLRAVMNQWQTSGRDEGALLRGAPLQQALEWAGADTIILSTMEKSFISLSQEAAERAEREKEAQHQRELDQAKALGESRRRQVLVVRVAAIGLGIMLLVALCGAIFAFWQRGVAQRNANEAEVQATAAFVAQATAVANEHIAATRAVEAEQAQLTAEQAQATAEADRLEAENQRSQAEAARAEAERERAEAIRQRQIALAQSLASLSLATVEQNNDRELATLLALEAVRLNEASNGNVAWYADRALRPLISQPYFNTTLIGHTNSVRAVAFAPDGRWLASGGADNSVRLWPLLQPDSEPIVLTGHEGPVLAVAFTADSQMVASGSEDGTIRLWNLAEVEQPPLLLAQGETAVLSIAIANGQLAASNLDGAVRLWNLADPTADPIVLLQQAQPTLGLAFSPDGRTLALAGDDRTVKLLDVAGGSAEATTVGQHDSSVISVAFDAGGSRLASTSVDNTVRVWNLAAPAESPLILQGHTSRVRGVVFLPDGQRLVSAGDDNTLRVWNLNDPDSGPIILPGHQLRVRALALSPDGRLVASASDDQTIRLWQTETPAGADRVLTGHEASVLAVTFAAAGATMVTAGADENIRLWETAGWTQTAVLAGHTERVRALAVNGNLLASGSDDSTIRLWNLDDVAAEPAVLAGHQGSVRALLWSEDGQSLYSAGDDGLVRVWAAADSGAPPIVLAVVEGAIYSLAWGPDGRHLLAGRDNGSIFIWELDNPEAEPIVLEGHQARVNDLAFSPDGRLLASASEDWTIHLWQWDDPGPAGAEPALLAAHSAGVRGLAFSPDGRQLVSTGQDQSVLRWNVADPAEPPAILNGHTAAVLDVAFVPNQPLFATVSDDGTIRLWQSLATLAELGCQLVRRNLTAAEWEAFLGGEAYRPSCPNLPS